MKSYYSQKTELFVQVKQLKSFSLKKFPFELEKEGIELDQYSKELFQFYDSFKNLNSLEVNLLRSTLNNLLSPSIGNQVINQLQLKHMILKYKVLLSRLNSSQRWKEFASQVKKFTLQNKDQKNRQQDLEVLVKEEKTKIERITRLIQDFEQKRRTCRVLIPQIQQKLNELDLEKTQLLMAMKTNEQEEAKESLQSHSPDEKRSLIEDKELDQRNDIFLNILIEHTLRKETEALYSQRSSLERMLNNFVRSVQPQVLNYVSFNDKIIERYSVAPPKTSEDYIECQDLMDGRMGCFKFFSREHPEVNFKVGFNAI